MDNEKEELRLWFHKLAEFAVEKKASDIFINTNLSIAIKIDGDLSYLRKFVFNETEVYRLIEILTRPEEYSTFIETHELNTMIEVPNVAYFRINAYMQRNLPGLVLRLVPTQVPELDSLMLPQVTQLRKLAMAKRGLIIISGATGQGKSTTLAAMVNHRNCNSNHHIITIEDPIEFMHTSKKSIVIQREVGVDTQSYSVALKNLLREAPDVILIGEIRDAEVMHYAIQLAETGHLCLATLHASDTTRALQRIYSFFPLDQREKLQMDLMNNLSCLITQRLLPRKKGGRIMASEMMVSTPYIKQLIGEGQIDKIHDVIEHGDPEYGLLSFDKCIFDLYEKEEIEYQDALQYIHSANDFRIRIRKDSKLPLPEELSLTGQSYSVQSTASLEHELLMNERAARKKARQKK